MAEVLERGATCSPPSEGDPPPYEPIVPPDDEERDKREDNDIPDTPGIEPPPVPIQDPLPEGTPAGPYIAHDGW
jgi:hypothetical protein